MKIGLQTFTIRKLTKHNLGSSLLLIKRLGINHVELARIKFNLLNADITKASHVNVTSIQVKMNYLIKKFTQIVEFCKLTNCQIVVVSVLSIKAIIGGEKALIEFCDKMNFMADKYNQEQIQFAFHHHDFEFAKINGKSKLDIILENTNPNVKIVSDTYWAKKCNIEPEALIEHLNDRLIGVHLRGYSLVENKVKDSEVKAGLINFKNVIEKAKVFATYCAIEQNTKTPFRSIRTSVEYLKSLDYQDMFEI